MLVNLTPLSCILAGSCVVCSISCRALIVSFLMQKATNAVSSYARRFWLWCRMCGPASWRVASPASRSDVVAVPRSTQQPRGLQRLRTLSNISATFTVILSSLPISLSASTKTEFDFSEYQPTDMSSQAPPSDCLANRVPIINLSTTSSTPTNWFTSNLAGSTAVFFMA